MNNIRTKNNVNKLAKLYYEIIYPEKKYSSLMYNEQIQFVYRLKNNLIERINILLDTQISRYKKHPEYKEVIDVDELDEALEEAESESEKKHYKNLKKLIENYSNIQSKIEENEKSAEPKDMTKQKKRMRNLYKRFKRLNDRNIEDRWAKITTEEIEIYMLMLYIMEPKRYKKINLLMKLRCGEWEIIPEAEREILLICINSIKKLKNWDDVYNEINCGLCRSRIMQPLKHRIGTSMHEIACFLHDICDLSNADSEMFFQDNFNQLKSAIKKLHGLKEVYYENYDVDAEFNKKYNNINEYNRIDKCIKYSPSAPDKVFTIQSKKHGFITFSITKTEYKRIESYFPIQRGNVKIDNFKFINAILYVANRKIQWYKLPEEFGEWSTIYKRFVRWKQNGYLVRIFKAMRDNMVCSQDAINMYMRYFKMEDGIENDIEIDFDAIKDTPIYDVFYKLHKEIYGDTSDSSDYEE